MIEYPKMLYLRGWADLEAHVTVLDETQEAEARAAGYKPLGPLPDAAAAPVVDEVPEAPKRRGRPPKAIAA
jgi:hypothetical protein